MSCKDNKDGSCSVEYVPFTTGLYDVNITYGGEHIPGESASFHLLPFSAFVAELFGWLFVVNLVGFFSFCEETS